VSGGSVQASGAERDAPLLDVGDRLPDMRLETAARGSVRLGVPRTGAPVLLLPPSALPEDEYVRVFLEAAGELEVWDGRPLLVIEPGGAEQPSHPDLLSASASSGDLDRVVLDAGGRLRRSLGVGAEWWGLFVADRWGVLYFATRRRHAAELPDAAELREWVKFLATQCPECGVIDEPPPNERNPP
jgi:hypothetical protein